MSSTHVHAAEDFADEGDEAGAAMANARTKFLTQVGSTNEEFFFACNTTELGYLGYIKITLRGPFTLIWELRTGDCKITLEDKQKIGNLTYYISSESLRDAESE